MVLSLGMVLGSLLLGPLASANTHVLCAPDQPKEEAKFLVLNTMNDIQDCELSFKIASECSFDKTTDSVLLARTLATCEEDAKRNDEQKRKFDSDYANCSKGHEKDELESSEVLSCKRGLIRDLIDIIDRNS